MKNTKLVLAFALALLSTAASADGFKGAGITYGMDHNGTFGFRGEYDIASAVDNQPVRIVAYYKRATQTFFGVSANASALGFTANYDLSKELQIKNRKLQPFVGFGLERVSAEAVTQSLGSTIKATSNKLDLSYSFGAKYLFSSQIDLTASLDSFDGLTLGVNYKF